jgi:hypothetical protein
MLVEAGTLLAVDQVRRVTECVILPALQPQPA